ncbi:MAG: hypothetical protein K2I73_04520, partial [Eubacterium sp.]|nr:hypothetical protein [Eubacterium sp.]
SYVCFSKISSYKESIVLYNKSISSVQKTELLILLCFIAFLTAEAILINIIYIIANSQFSFSLLFNTVTSLLCYFTLGLITSVFIGLSLSFIRKKYIVYLLMVVLLVSEIELTQTAAMHIFEYSGIDFSKILEIFCLVPYSIRWTPNEQTGVVFDINKISLLLFYIVLSILVFVVMNGRSKKEKIKKGTLCFILCICLSFGYFVPISFYKASQSPSGIMHDDLYYQFYEDCQKEEKDAFRVVKYDLHFSAFLNLKADAKIYVDNKNLQKYKFTLYNKYKVSEVTNQNGSKLDFTQEYDYLTIDSGNSDTEYLNIKYSGGSTKYYSSYAGVLLPSNFAYYPIPGFHKTFDSYYGFFDHSLPYNTAFNVEFSSSKTVYCNLEETEKNKFKGYAKSIILLSGNYKTEKIDDTTIIYPYFSKTYKPEQLNEHFKTFIKDNRNIKKIFILPHMPLPEYSGIKTYDDYLFTNSKFDIERRSFESKIDVNKFLFYNLVCAYYDEETDDDYLNSLENNASNEEKKMISLLKNFFASEQKEEISDRIADYLIDENDMRAPLEFLTALEEK